MNKENSNGTLLDTSRFPDPQVSSRAAFEHPATTTNTDLATVDAYVGGGSNQC